MPDDIKIEIKVRKHGDSAGSLHGVVLPPCEWEGRDGKKCGMPSKYELGFPDEDKVMLCSLHFSRASTLGWPVRKRQNDQAEP